MVHKIALSFDLSELIHRRDAEFFHSALVAPPALFAGRGFSECSLTIVGHCLPQWNAPP
jgi:hypothetical protein